MRLQYLQSAAAHATAPTCQPVEKAALPPHLISITNHIATASNNYLNTHGPAEPFYIATGPAEPFNPAQQASAVPQQTAPFRRAPRPEEASRE
jgi:hypothetical protein